MVAFFRVDLAGFQLTWRPSIDALVLYLSQADATSPGAIFTQVGWCARHSEIPGIVAGVDRGDERLDSDLTWTAIKADTQLGKWTLSWHAHCDAAFAAGRHHASGARPIVCLGAPVWASQEAAFPATEGGASPGYLACTTNAGNASGVFGGRRGVRLGRHAILS